MGIRTKEAFSSLVTNPRHNLFTRPIVAYVHPASEQSAHHPLFPPFYGHRSPATDDDATIFINSTKAATK